MLHSHLRWRQPSISKENCRQRVRACQQGTLITYSGLPALLGPLSRARRSGEDGSMHLQPHEKADNMPKQHQQDNIAHAIHRISWQCNALISKDLRRPNWNQMPSPNKSILTDASLSYKTKLRAVSFSQESMPIVGRTAVASYEPHLAAAPTSCVK